MKKIHVLDADTINKIAAGEVVERPASVVKELVENSIDSGALNISVEIKDGGKSLITIMDDGCGISPEDIPVAFSAHATSKIKNANDLFFIRTLGFRGEALASIGAISKITLKTKTTEDISGTLYRYEGGKTVDVKDTGLNTGTSICVQDIFYNTPARLKFLKSSMTETSHITEIMNKFVLSNEGIGFKYIVDGVLKFNIDPRSTLKERIYSLFGREISENLYELSVDDGHYKIKGFVSKPSIARGNRNQQHFFINGRSVKSPLIGRALDDAYRNYLMPRKYPFCVIYIEIDPMLIDVNIHPTKQEVKFENESRIYNSLFESISYALKNRELVPEITLENYAKQVGDQVKKAQNDASVKEPVSEKKIFEIPVMDDEVYPRKFSLEEKTEKVKELLPSENLLDAFVKEEAVPEVIKVSEDQPKFLDDSQVIKKEIIGQLFDTYWLVSFGEKLYIIDQHAAHEKVLYERIIKNVKSGNIPKQNLMIPLVLTVADDKKEWIIANEDGLLRMGFTMEDYGGSEIIVTTVPMDLFGSDIKEWLIDIIDNVSDVNDRNLYENIDDRIATMACKAAVKGNNRLSEEEARALIKELMDLDNPYNCPHGRPTMVSISKNDIEKMFKRIV